MYMHITPQDGSSSGKKKDLAFKASQEKKGKSKVKEVALDSSSDDEVDDANIALMVRKTTKMLKRLNKSGVKFDSKNFFTSSKRKPISEMNCYNCDIESSNGSSAKDSDDKKEKVAALIITTSLPPPPPPPSSFTHLCLMAKGDRKVQSDDDSSGNESGSDSDDEFESSTYDQLVALLNDYSKIIRKTRAKNQKLKLENESLLAKYGITEKANDELREENKVVSSTLKELKTSLKELKEKHDKLEGIHKVLNTRYNLLKEEYTTLKIHHDNLVLSHEFLSNEPHHATNNVVKIDISTSCDDLIVESIEQGSSSKGKQVIVANHYDYVKIKNENENLKKDLENISSNGGIVIETLNDDMALENEMLREENKRLKMEKGLEKPSTNKTNVIETQDDEYDMALDIEMLREEKKRLKMEKNHLATGLHKFTKGHNLQSSYS
ncbi:sporulation-specific protein 15-like [Miscanthus floridulus]|uniref:sporulation-specific protein 15-like n=1 Tax=Miscanthus floridulus TaxID=154761 RepID=UPI003458B634